VRGIYQLAAEMDEKRRVLNAWAEQVRAMALVPRMGLERLEPVVEPKHSSALSSKARI
jgi:hypothetical protein